MVVILASIVIKAVITISGWVGSIYGFLTGFY